MSKKFFFVITAIFFISTAFAQNDSTFNSENYSMLIKNRHSIQLELTLIQYQMPNYSLNYEFLLLNNPKFKTVIHAGFTEWPKQTGLYQHYRYFGVSELFSFNKHHIECGIENSHAWIDDSNWDLLFFSGVVGYRFQPPQKGYILKVLIKPTYLTGWNIHDTFMFNFSIGGGISFSFNKIFNKKDQ